MYSFLQRLDCRECEVDEYQEYAYEMCYNQRVCRVKDIGYAKILKLIRYLLMNEKMYDVMLYGLGTMMANYFPIMVNDPKFKDVDSDDWMAVSFYLQLAVK